MPPLASLVAESDPAALRRVIASQRLEIDRLARSREELANRLQAVQLLVQIMDDNPTLSVRTACQHAGVDYDTHILNRR